MSAVTRSTFFGRPVRRPRLSLSLLAGLWRQRRGLARLDERMLRDIGVSPQEAAREAARPLWDAPPNWLR